MIRFTELYRMDEAIKANTVDEALETIKSKSLGVKIPDSIYRWFTTENENPFKTTNARTVSKDEQIKNCLETLFSIFKNNRIDNVLGLQVVLGYLTMSDPKRFVDCIWEDSHAEKAMAIAIKNWNNDWFFEYSDMDSWSESEQNEAISELKDLKEHKWEGNDADVANFFGENAPLIIDKGYTHGSISKGKGNIDDVMMLYPVNARGKDIDLYKTDEEGWQLFVPESFDGERAIAWYGTGPKDMKPTNWCTRASIRSFWNYTGEGDLDDDFPSYDECSPLYVIRNLKTGKAWQVSIHGHDGFDFLNEKDQDDQYTKGNLDIFPDELLMKVEDSAHDNFGGTGEYETRTLLDAKNLKDEALDEYGNDDRYMRDFINPETASRYKFVNAKVGEEIDLGNGIVKARILNGTMSETPRGDYDVNNSRYSIFNKDYDNFEYENDIESYRFRSVFGKKSGNIYKYYFKENPSVFIIGGASGGKVKTFFDNTSYGNDENKDTIQELSKAAKNDLGMSKGDTRREERLDKIRRIYEESFMFEPLTVPFKGGQFKSITIEKVHLPKNITSYVHFTAKDDLHEFGVNHFKYPFIFEVTLNHATSPKLDSKGYIMFTTESGFLRDEELLSHLDNYQKQNPLVSQISRGNSKIVLFKQINDSDEFETLQNLDYASSKNGDATIKQMQEDIKKAFIPLYAKMSRKLKNGMSSYLTATARDSRTGMFEAVYRHSN